MSDNLKIITWPDPRLLKVSEEVTDFNGALRDLAQRMFHLMREARGVGLAAPQVGVNIRMFVMNHSGRPEDDRVIVNPVLSDPEGEEEAEEGCLSLPSINIQVRRIRTVTLRAQDMDGKPLEFRASGYVARIWQHEIDHLDGILLTERMGVLDRMKARKTLKQLREEYEAAHGRTGSKGLLRR